MYDWAVSQGMEPETHAKLITDTKPGSKVTPDQIWDGA